MAAASRAVRLSTKLLGAVSKSLAALAAPATVRVRLPLASIWKNPSALVLVPVAVKVKPVTATLSLKARVARVAPAARFSA